MADEPVPTDLGYMSLPGEVQRELEAGSRPRIVCLCGSTRFYDAFQQANYDLTMRGEIVLSVGFYPHAKAEHGHGEGVGHDSGEKTALDELHKRKIDLADYCLVVSDKSGYFGASTRSEIAYAVAHGKPVEFAEPAARQRAADTGLLGEESTRRVVMAPGIADLVAIGNGPLLDPSCREGQHVLCLGAPCECPVPGVHSSRHDRERSQT